MRENCRCILQRSSCFRLCKGVSNKLGPSCAELRQVWTCQALILLFFLDQVCLVWFERFGFNLPLFGRDNLKRSSSLELQPSPLLCDKCALPSHPIELIQPRHALCAGVGQNKTYAIISGEKGVARQGSLLFWAKMMQFSKVRDYF